jgi:pimeloyl-ACP methyl ester carboxylesterase/membrane protein DedA with SNARE-associated domain
MSSRRFSWRKRFVASWLAILCVSYLAWWLRPHLARPLPNGASECEVAEFSDGSPTSEQVKLVWREYPALDPSAPAVLLVHGSPGRKENFERVAESLAGRFRLIVPDLPGFGNSQHNIADYSIDAQARELLALCDHLGLRSVHVLGFSLGGGTALEMAHLAPDRIRSLVLLSSVGVQELELFGNYELNHALHGLQLSLILFARWALPHFGLDDGLATARAYARSFFDSDQRPLRAILESIVAPVLVVHGEHDFLVPPAAAREHHRIVPQSELAMLDGDQFLLWTRPAELAELLADWLGRVESHAVPSRSAADPDRLRAAAIDFDPADVPPFEGPALFLLLVLIASATLVSEDLTCIAVGLLVAQGRLSFVPGTLAAFVGIFTGDASLYIAGRFIGRAALTRAPLRWFIHPDGIERAKAWFVRRGARVIFASRFVPGLRLPTYFAAGAVHAGFLTFCFYFILAGILWTPILVGLSAWIGSEVVSSVAVFERLALPGLLAFALMLFVVQRFVVPLFSWRGRRLLRGRLKRRIAFEFWPPWVFYAPVAAEIARLALRYRSLTVVTAANPAMPTGGFIGESKTKILAAIDTGEGDVARFVPIPAALPAEERLRVARAFLEEFDLSFPVVLKPDVGQRGSGVSILSDERSFEAALEGLRVDSMLQEFAPGMELGVFYVRHPDEPHGRIFSITEKRLPVVVGDGRRTLEELILADSRAVCMAPTYFEINAPRLLDVPEHGEHVNLVELGTHCRGAIFLDGSWARSTGLESAIERISRRYEGFHFGRYDLRVSAPEELASGRGFKVIELNGLTSEATHIYDPRTRLFEAWGVLFEQWRLAFAIGARNRQRGARVWTVSELAHEVRAYKKLQALHLPTGWQWELEEEENAAALGDSSTQS